MGELRPRFWELPLEDLTRAEWEALCDGCGQCCLHKLEDADTGEIVHTNVACKLLDTGTARCSDYRHRRTYVPDCLRLNPRNLKRIAWLPRTCAYVVRERGEALPEWHYLIAGDRDAIQCAGASVIGRVVSEIDAGPLEHHIIDWADDGIDDDTDAGDAG